jgi:hypothetical protein
LEEKPDSEVAVDPASLVIPLVDGPEKGTAVHSCRRTGISMTDKDINGANLSIEGLVAAVNGWRG